MNKLKFLVRELRFIEKKCPSTHNMPGFAFATTPNKLSVWNVKGLQFGRASTHLSGWTALFICRIQSDFEYGITVIILPYSSEADE
jgi:hypothetical protein